MDRCMTAPPHIISCHATTVWWIYQEWEDRGRRNADWDTFINRGYNVADLIASLIRVYGHQRTRWWTKGGIKVDRGSVVVFAGVNSEQMYSAATRVCVGAITACTEAAKGAVLIAHTERSLSALTPRTRSTGQIRAQ